MLNDGDMAMYAGYSLIVAASLVTAALVFEGCFAPTHETQTVRVVSMAANAA